MALTVALKQNGKVYMGYACISTHEDIRQRNININSYELFKQKNIDNMLISVSSPRENQVIKYADIISELDALKGNIDIEFMVNKFVPKVFEILNKNGLILNEHNNIPTMRCEMTVAYKDKLFRIFSDGCVIEYDNFSCVGSGEEAADVSLMESKNISDPFERIKLALLASREQSVGADYPFIISDTESCELKVIKDPDEEDSL